MRELKEPNTMRAAVLHRVGDVRLEDVPVPDAGPEDAKVSPSTIPRWRGFNLLDLWATSTRWRQYFPMGDGVFSEEDFVLIRELGFDFVRVPMSYLYFIGDASRRLDPERLTMVDQVVQFGCDHGVHVQLNFHRAPGYCVLSYPFDTPETGNIFEDGPEQDLFVQYWTTLSDRYRGVPNRELSFDLINEPPPVETAGFSMEGLRTLYERTVEAVRSKDTHRLVFVESPYHGSGELPLEWLEALDVGGSPHCYLPPQISVYRAPWNEHPYDEPVWPLPGDVPGGDGNEWNRARLESHLRPWLEAARSGRAIHMGETGTYNKTPHAVILAWLDDLLSILTEHGIGYALWDFRGCCGILDSERDDIEYEDWNGHKLDRAMVDLLQRY